MKICWGTCGTYGTYTLVSFPLQMLRETNWNIFFRSIDELVHILDDFPYPLKRFQVFPSLRAILFYTS